MNQIADAVARVSKFQGDPYFERHCHGKVPHATEAEAKKHAKRMHKLQKKKYDAYQCKFCNQWHIGGRLRK